MATKTRTKVGIYLSVHIIFPTSSTSLLNPFDFYIGPEPVFCDDLDAITVWLISFIPFYLFLSIIFSY